MRVYSVDDKAGSSILIYGETGRGKTYSFNTVSGNLLLINQEPKNPLAKIHKKNIRAFGMESFDEGIKVLTTLIKHTKENGKCLITRTFLNEIREVLEIDYDIVKLDKDEPFEVEVIGFDSITSFSRTLREQLEDSVAKEQAGKVAKELSRALFLHERFKVDWEGWGSLASQMHRIHSLFNTLTIYGVNIIVIARASGGGFGLDITLDGKEFKKHVFAYFDGVGAVIPNGGGSPYPPKVVFCLSEDFPIAKPPCESERLSKPEGGTLNWDKIFEIIEESKNSSNKKKGDKPIVETAESK